MSSTHKTRTDDARHAAAHASNPQERRHPRGDSAPRSPTADPDHDASAHAGDTSDAHRRTAAPEPAGRRRTGSAANDDDALDAASRDAMASGDPLALPSSPTLSRTRE